MSFRLGVRLATVVLLSACLSDAVQVPARPEITPAPHWRRDAANQLIGYTNVGGQWVATYCGDGQTYTEAGNWAGCCATSSLNCALTTACSSLTMLDIFGNKPFTCFTNFPCQTGTIFESSGATAAKSKFGCGGNNWVMYRTPPVTSSLSSTKSGSNAATTASSPSGQSGGASSSSSSASPTNTGSPAPSSSKAWIAGAVVGPVVGIALIGLAAWFLLRRRKSKKQPAELQPGMAPANNDVKYGHQQQPPPMAPMELQGNTYQEAPIPSPQNYKYSQAPQASPAELPSSPAHGSHPPQAGHY